MPRYTVNHRYESRRDGRQWGPWVAGTVVDLSPADAAWLNADSPGVVVLEVEPEPTPVPPVPEPPKAEAVREKVSTRNRMVTGGPNRAA